MVMPIPKTRDIVPHYLYLTNRKCMLFIWCTITFFNYSPSNSSFLPHYFSSLVYVLFKQYNISFACIICIWKNRMLINIKCINFSWDHIEGKTKRTITLAVDGKWWSGIKWFKPEIWMDKKHLIMCKKGQTLPTPCLQVHG